ncbi:hypothetical protein K0U00_29760, partial [Paenibacillus sepulcri]|nr:hypothetical protein [Paenibacillus sepulcri]
EGAKQVQASVRRALAIRGEEGQYKARGHLQIRRGPYLIAHRLDETNTAEDIRFEGRYIDLFEAELPVLQGVALKPGEDCLLYDLSWTREGSGAAEILISSSQIRDERLEANRLTFFSESPSDMTVSTRIRMANEPVRAVAGGQPAEWSRDAESGTVLVRYPGSPEGVEVTLEW